jgi:signal transduction histidine kinase
MQAIRVLIVEDSPTDAELIVRELRRAGFAPDFQRVDTEEGFLVGLDRHPDIVLSDDSLPLFSGQRALTLWRERGQRMPFVIVSGTIGEEAAVAAMKLGAADYLLKDRLGRLGPAVSQALEQSHLRLERARAEEKVRELNSDLERRVNERTTELAIAKERAEASDRFKSEFLANMSHELRTPLNAIIGFAELMHKGKVGPVSAEHHEYLGDILTGARHLLALINDVLDLAKVESGKMEFRPEPIDLSKLAHEVRDMLRGLAADKHIRVEIHVDPVIAAVIVDPTWVKQILYNYLSNAIKFTSDSGAVEIRMLREDGATFKIEVEDNGVGIAPEDLKKLFIEFQQLDAGTAKKYQGTGLGLVLTKRLAEAHGGGVSVRSTPGVGSVFAVTLPCVASSTVRPKAPPPVVPMPSGSPTILVVDDDPAALKLVGVALRELGYRTVCQERAEDALLIAETLSPAAVVTDLLMPGIDGFEFIARLRTTPAGEHVPIFVWTVKDLDARERRQLEAFAAVLVTKRAGGPQSLVEELARALHARTPAKPDASGD